MDQLTLPPNAEAALSRLQDTSLTPMEEALFQAWLKANKIDDPDNPKDSVDYRGIYKATNGIVAPNGDLKRMTEDMNLRSELEKALHEKMMERIQETVGKEEDMQNQLHKEERQDITHKQKMEMEGMKLKRAPHDLKMKDYDIKGKEIDIKKQHLGLDQQKLGNEGKRIDLIASLMAPKPAAMPTSKPTSKPSGNK